MKKAGKILGLFVLGIIMISLMAESVLALPTWSDVGNFFVGMLAPEVGIASGPVAVLIGLIGAILILMIIGDILNLVSPLSNYVNWSIAVGVTIIMLVVGWVRTFIAVIMSFVAGLFGVGGTIVLGATAVLFIFAILFLYFGIMPWVQHWIVNMKARKEELKGTEAALSEATKIRKGKIILTEAGKPV
jgi:hypothetical protein